MTGECLSVGHKSFPHQQTQLALNIHFKNPIPLVTRTPALTHGRSSSHDRITHLTAGSGSLSEFLSGKPDTVKFAEFSLLSLIQFAFLKKYLSPHFSHSHAPKRLLCSNTEERIVSSVRKQSWEKIAIFILIFFYLCHGSINCDFILPRLSRLLSRRWCSDA